MVWLVVTGCGPTGPDGRPGSGSAQGASQGYDFGQDWESDLRPRPPDGEFEPTEDQTYWVLVLATFTSDQHVANAQQWLTEARTLLPELSAARVEPHRHGSMVVWGRYTGWEDPQAETDREYLLAMQFNGQRLFPSAVLKRIEPPLDPSEVSPYDLRAARLEYPKIDPLYTLDVAVWTDVDDPDGMDRRVRRGSAESYARQLRGKNLPAFFHHNEDLQMSSVTVGLFDRTALDPSTGMRSIDVDELAQRFPARLLNGEPLMAPADPLDPSRGSYQQRPFLVEVPH